MNNQVSQPSTLSGLESTTDWPRNSVTLTLTGMMKDFIKKLERSTLLKCNISLTMNGMYISFVKVVEFHGVSLN